MLRRYFSRCIIHCIANPHILSVLRKKSRFGDAYSIPTFADSMALRTLVVMHIWYALCSQKHPFQTVEMTYRSAIGWTTEMPLVMSRIIQTSIDCACLVKLLLARAITFLYNLICLIILQAWSTCILRA